MMRSVAIAGCKLRLDEEETMMTEFRVQRTPGPGVGVACGHGRESWRVGWMQREFWGHGMSSSTGRKVFVGWRRPNTHACAYRGTCRETHADRHIRTDRGRERERARERR